LSRLFFSSLFSYFNDNEKIDVICLQETHSIKDDLIRWQNEWENCGGGNSIFNGGTSGNNAEACRDKPKIWDVTYKVDFVNNIDVDSIQNLKIQLENLNMSLTTVYMFEIIWLLPVATFSPSMHDISRTYKKSLKILVVLHLMQSYHWVCN
jgi:exonuclease III